MKENHIYNYHGPVMSFDKIIANNWYGGTVAISESQARNNLAYQFKKMHGLEPSAKISLPGEIVMVK